ncbi:hypothetical protein GCK72_003516 [Caenorhabditis remanei]|uniref:Uncharacterized protein n=1 Tax=Caenorhabditis remanei TaxID=31234 RepID=A0A6A5HV42_CAERE|nr:hypothetical protein GCK72_003516 [Caenorhabditis remanei]KAF1771689.1 hypothetical protein GCK72_003516 [Caenorhabditis remanei]
MSSQMIGSDLSLEMFNIKVDNYVKACTSNPGICDSNAMKQIKILCLADYEIATCDAMVNGVFKKFCASRPVDKKDAAYCKKLFPDSTTSPPPISTTPPSSIVSNLTIATAISPESSNNLGLLIGCLVGAFFLVIIVIVLFCWWRRRKLMDKELSSIGGKSESKSKKPVIAENKRKSIWIMVDDGDEIKK